MPGSTVFSCTVFAFTITCTQEGRAVVRTMATILRGGVGAGFGSTKGVKATPCGALDAAAGAGAPTGVAWRYPLDHAALANNSVIRTTTPPIAHRPGCALRDR